MRRLTNFKLGIGFPCSWPQVPFPTFLSILQMEKPEFVLIPATNGPIDGLRNSIVEEALAAGCSHLLMPDLDQTYPVDLIPRLLAHKKSVVGAMVHRRYPPFDPLVFERDGLGGGHRPIMEWEPGELLKVSRTGTGCLLYDMRVFQDIPRPWFEFSYTDDGRVLGEDFGFCDKLHAAGYEMFVDSGVKCGHLSTLEITEETWHLYRAMQRAKQRAAEKAADHGQQG